MHGFSVTQAHEFITLHIIHRGLNNCKDSFGIIQSIKWPMQIAQLISSLNCKYDQV